MPKWAKIVAGCLALMIGASAPSLILFGLNPRIIPSNREARYQGYSAASDAGQENIERRSTIQTQQPEDQHAVARAKSIPQSEGNSGPEWWVAFWTFWLFIATTALWLFTALMWWATRRAVTDGKRAIEAAIRHADAAIAAERAYISGGGPAAYYVIDDYGSGIQTHTVLAGVPNKFELQVNNYGKTPGELIEIHIGWLDGTVPDDVPVIEHENIVFFQDWIKPDTASRTIEYIEIPTGLKHPIVFGRIYYRDIIMKKLHSSGFILQLSAQRGSQPIRAPRAYTEERDEESDEPPSRRNDG